MGEPPKHHNTQGWQKELRAYNRGFETLNRTYNEGIALDSVRCHQQLSAITYLCGRYMLMSCYRLVKCIFSIYLSALFLSATHALFSTGQSKFQPGRRSLFPKSNLESQQSISVDGSLSNMSNSSSQDLIHRFDEALLGGHKLCVIARGLPGRGKTTLVQEIVTHYESSGEFTAVMVAADDYMIDSSGEKELEIMLMIKLTWSTNILIEISTIQVSTRGRQTNSIMRIPNAVKISCWLLNTGFM
jgi:hypothetical protein